MSIRGLGDGYAYRLLWLLVGTVIVPTVLLSLFGVAAIRNQGAAVLQGSTACAPSGAGSMAPARSPRGRRRRAAMLQRSTACVPARRAARPAVPGTSRGLELVGRRGARGDRIARRCPRASAEGHVVWVLPVDGSEPLGLVSRGARRFAWRLDPRGCRRASTGSRAERLPERVALRLAGPEPAARRQLRRPGRPRARGGRPRARCRAGASSSTTPTTRAAPPSPATAGCTRRASCCSSPW
ncbi:MAG: hypothetical protein R3F59_16800 [Myxococcota bacterium]